LGRQVMNDNKRPVLVLDLDGTLVNTKPDLVAALNVAIESVGLAPVPDELIGHGVGQGVRAMLAKSFSHYDEPLSDELQDELFVKFINYYSNNIANFSKPYSGVQAALRTFSNSGWHLAVCTNKPENMAKSLLNALDMDDQFAAICGLDTFPVSKPHADHILKTISMAGGRVEGSVMVGDTATDVDAAKNSGIPSIVVDFGYSPTPVQSLGASKIISNFDQLWDAVEQI